MGALSDFPYNKFKVDHKLADFGRRLQIVPTFRVVIPLKLVRGRIVNLNFGFSQSKD